MAVTTGTVAVPANQATLILTQGASAGWAYLTVTAGAQPGSSGGNFAGLGVVVGPSSVTLANGYPLLSPIYLQASDALYAISPVACTITWLLP